MSPYNFGRNKYCMEKQQAITFVNHDFDCFREEHSRNREYNKFRLKVRRKLGDLGHSLLPELQKNGLSLEVRTSLHHPYSYNRFCVDSQWVYLSPTEQVYQTLRQNILGPELGQDLDTHYTQTLLLVGIHHLGLFISLKIHPSAWWDGHNLKNKCSQKEQRSQLLELLHRVPDFSLRLHEWPNRHSCANMTMETLAQYFNYYVPMQHWLHLDRDIPKENALASSTEFTEFAQQQLVTLIPLYRFIVWSPENNYVFEKKGEKFYFRS